VEVGDGKYALIDAGHDLKAQLEHHGLTPRPLNAEGFRESRVEAVFLTHGHADHTVGLAEFCTGKSFGIPVYGPPDLLEFLFGPPGRPNYFGALGRLARDYVKPLELEAGVPVDVGGVKFMGFEAPHTQTLEDGSKYPSSTYVYKVSGGGSELVYAPDLGRLDPWFMELIEDIDVLLLDATFWWDDELRRISNIPVTSKQLGHVPMEEALVALSDSGVGRVVFTHLNHTNPVLDPANPQRKAVEEAGMEIAFDGMRLRL